MSTPGSSVPANRARTQAVLFGALSVVVAGATAATAWWVVSQYEDALVDAQRSPDDRTVVVAATDLLEGDVLAPEDLKLGSAPAGTPTESLFTNTEGLIGKTIAEKVLAGEPVRLERLTEGGASLGLNEVIDPGARAITIRTNHASAVGGLLRPGFFVDVIVTIRPDTTELTANWVTETILQGVRVVAVNDSVSSSPTLVQGPEGRQDARDIFVTLEVQPAEAEEVALAASRGQLHLALRHVEDLDMLDPGTPLVANALVGLPTSVRGATEARLQRKRTNARLATPSAAPPELTTTEVIRGNRVTIEQYDENDRRVTPPKR